MATKKAVFVVHDYKDRLRLLREILSGDSQVEFAKMLGIPWKRWSTYERGYPIPRETAWLLWDKFDISIEWIWYGSTLSVTPAFQRKLEEVKQRHKEQAAAQVRVERTTAAALEAKSELQAMRGKGRKARQVRQVER